MFLLPEDLSICQMKTDTMANFFQEKNPLLLYDLANNLLEHNHQKDTPTQNPASV